MTTLFLQPNVNWHSYTYCKKSLNVRLHRKLLVIFTEDSTSCLLSLRFFQRKIDGVLCGWSCYTHNVTAVHAPSYLGRQYTTTDKQRVSSKIAGIVHQYTPFTHPDTSISINHRQSLRYNNELTDRTTAHGGMECFPYSYIQIKQATVTSRVAKGGVA